MWHHIRVLFFLALFDLQQQLNSRTNIIFLVGGKLVRFGMLFAFFLGLFSHTKTVAGYSLDQTLLFFLTFNIVDITAQMLFRGVYGVKRLVQEGRLDTYLAQPVNVLFRVMISTVDLFDAITFVPIIWVTKLVIDRIGGVTVQDVLLYVLLIGVGITIAFSIHVLVAALVVLSGEVDIIWIYRDLMAMGRFPTDIYTAPVQLVLTFIVPVAVMVSFPAKVLLGVLSNESVVFALVLAGLFLVGSLVLWQQALKHYASASS